MPQDFATGSVIFVLVTVGILISMQKRKTIITADYITTEITPFHFYKQQLPLKNISGLRYDQQYEEDTVWDRVYLQIQDESRTSSFLILEVKEEPDAGWFMQEVSDFTGIPNDY